MSAPAARLLAIPFALLAFGLGVLFNWWEGPPPDAVDEHLWLLALVAGVSVGIPLGGYVAVTIKRPASLRRDPDRRRFVARSSPASTTVPFVIMLMWSSGRTAAEGSFSWFAGIIAAIAGVLLLIDRPALSLTASGFTIVPLIGRRDEVGWDDVAPYDPPAAKLRRRDATLRLRGTQTLGPLGAIVTLPVVWLHVNPRFLLDAIRHYAEDPTHRGEIGTEAELERLRDVLRRQTQPIS